jgi:hypothetical protein
MLVEKLDTHSFVFEPRLVVAPIARLGISVGPYVQFDSGKSKSDLSMWDIDSSTIVGVQGGVALDLYAFIGK